MSKMSYEDLENMIGSMLEELWNLYGTTNYYYSLVSQKVENMANENIEVTKDMLHSLDNYIKFEIEYSKFIVVWEYCNNFIQSFTNSSNIENTEDIIKNFKYIVENLNTDFTIYTNFSENSIF